MIEASDIRLCARNCLAGKVLSAFDGAVSAKVVLELAGPLRVGLDSGRSRSTGSAANQVAGRPVRLCVVTSILI
ncbi:MULTISPECIES: hypothetical protein [unclassified Pseudomonas]|uniref:hypothetical protein n=1 Tax=unclassified Pseudomonas TaxID=196821 RepID=UPI00382BA344